MASGAMLAVFIVFPFQFDLRFVSIESCFCHAILSVRHPIKWNKGERHDATICDRSLLSVLWFLTEGGGKLCCEL